MNRRQVAARLLAMPALGLVAAACNQAPPSASEPGGVQGSGAKQDVKTVATNLLAKTTPYMDAITAKNDASITRTKNDLTSELVRAEDVIKSETGPAANQVNSAINLLRQAMITNDMARLERAKTLLQQATTP